MINKQEHPYIKMINSHLPIIFDGAMGTEIQKVNLTPKDFGGYSGCNEALVLFNSEIIKKIHINYINAGANIIETNTFGANRIKLKEFGLEKETYNINKKAVEIARNAIKECLMEQKVLVCGSMGPTGILLSGVSGSKISDFDNIVVVYKEQAKALIEGGVDLLLLETMHDLLEIRAAITGIRLAFAELQVYVPLQVHASMDESGHMLMGSDIFAFLGAVICSNVDAIGLNCNVGPDAMKENISRLLKHSPLPVCMMPNAGKPENIDGKAVYKMTPADFCKYILPLVTNNGLEIVGGCCGTSPEHISALSQALKDKYVNKRIVDKVAYCSSLISGKNLEAEKKPFIIGERLNAQGSKKTKEMLLAKNYNELYHIAFSQQQKGCTALDICVAVTEDSKEALNMFEVLSYLTQRISIPFCIDSTDPEVIETAIKACSGAFIINSINLEDGGLKAEKILTIASDYGCPVIALTIDKNGMAKTLDDKINIAFKLRELACEKYKLQEHYLYIDPLTFTLATGNEESADAAKISLEAITAIKTKMPNVNTVMGISNVSYGFSPEARRVLNNVMLYYAEKAGLDAAIFNPHHLDNIEKYDPIIRKSAEDLIFNRGKQCLTNFIDLFEKQKRSTNNDFVFVEKQLTLEEKLKNCIINRDSRNLEQILKSLLNQKAPQSILSEILLPSMNEVGEKMEKGEIILPFVLHSAEIMKQALSILEPYLVSKQLSKRGKIILATVFGDVHDIGKNLVGTILKNSGYEVIDLGKQVPVEDIIKAVKKENPDAIGLSALLVTTSREMAYCVEALEKENIKVPVLIGGAAVNKDFAFKISTLKNGEKYSAGVFYAKDAFEAIKILESIKNNNKQFNNFQTNSNSKENINGFKLQNITAQDNLISNKTNNFKQYQVISPFFYGTSQVLRWDANKILAEVDKSRLFKGYFGGGNLNEQEFVSAVEKDFIPSYEKLTKLILDEDLLDCAGLYGIFPVYTYDSIIVILDPNDFKTTLAEFEMPRMQRKNNISIADYFKQDGDVIGIQAVTIGKKIDKKSQEFLNVKDEYRLGFYLNGIANYITEHLANKVTAEIRKAFFISNKIGRRYSFGYPGLPPLEEQKKLLDLIGAEERLGITLTSGFQMIPQHSTCAIFVHNPEAEYF